MVLCVHLPRHDQEETKEYRCTIVRLWQLHEVCIRPTFISNFHVIILICIEPPVSRRINDCKSSLRESPFYNKLCEELNRCLESAGVVNITQVVCYGLGNFTSSVTSRYQLALLLLFKELFSVQVYLHDPVFSDTELDFLNKLQLTRIERNEEGARKINSSALIFMPHCPTALLNNLLWCNWGLRLSNCIVLGNSFNALSYTHTERRLKETFRYIHAILPMTTEIDVENTFTYTDIFNDLSWHYFPPVLLSELPKTFWKKGARPVYENADIECILNKLQNSSISETLVHDKIEHEKEE